MPARSRLLVIAACLAAALVGLPTAAQASNTKQITQKVNNCTAGIASVVTMWVTDLSEQEASSISVGVQTASSWVDAPLDYYDSNEEAAAYTATNLGARPLEARATVPQAWNGNMGVGVDCLSSVKPTVTPSCDLDGIDPKVLNVKVYNPNSSKITYAVAAAQTSGSPTTTYTKQQLSVLPYQTEEVDFDPIYDWSSYRVTVTGNDGSKVTKNLSCKAMPGSMDGSSNKRRGEIQATPAAIGSASSTVAPSPSGELLIPPGSPHAGAKKPASGWANASQMAVMLGIFVIFFGVPGAVLMYLWYGNRKRRLANAAANPASSGGSSDAAKP